MVKLQYVAKIRTLCNRKDHESYGMKVPRFYVKENKLAVGDRLVVTVEVIRD